MLYESWIITWHSAVVHYIHIKKSLFVYCRRFIDCYANYHQKAMKFREKEIAGVLLHRSYIFICFLEFPSQQGHKYRRFVHIYFVYWCPQDVKKPNFWKHCEKSSWASCLLLCERKSWQQGHAKPAGKFDIRLSWNGKNVWILLYRERVVWKRGGISNKKKVKNLYEIFPEYLQKHSSLKICAFKWTWNCLFELEGGKIW